MLSEFLYLFLNLLLVESLFDKFCFFALFNFLLFSFLGENLLLLPLPIEILSPSITPLESISFIHPAIILLLRFLFCLFFLIEHFVKILLVKVHFHLLLWHELLLHRHLLRKRRHLLLLLMHRHLLLLLIHRHLLLLLKHRHFRLLLLLWKWLICLLLRLEIHLWSII